MSIKTTPFACLLFLSFLLAGIDGYSQESYQDFLDAGIKAYDEGNYQEAITLYEKALELQPSSMGAYYEMGLTYYTLEDYNNAIACFQYAETAMYDVTNKRLLYSTWGSALDDAGKPEEAIKILDRGLELGIDARLLFNRGVTYIRIGNMDEAEKNFIRALEEEPFHAGTLQILADLQEAKGNDVDAFCLRCSNLLTAPQGEYAADVLHLVAASSLLAEESDADSVPSIPFKQRILRMESVFPALDKTQLALSVCRIRYAPLLDDICQSIYFETFVTIITASSDDISRNWVSSHVELVENFYNWVNGNKYVNE